MTEKITDESILDLKRISQTIVPIERDWIYMAALIDLQGCLRIQYWKDKRKGTNETFTISYEIGTSKFSLATWLLQRFGGSFTYHKQKKPTHSAYIIWEIRSEKLENVLSSVSPYLILKKERVGKIYEFLETKISHSLNRHSPEFKKKSKDIADRRKLLIEEFKSLP